MALQLAGVARKVAALSIKVDDLALKRADVTLQLGGLEITISGACGRAGCGAQSVVSVCVGAVVPVDRP